MWMITHLKIGAQMVIAALFLITYTSNNSKYPSTESFTMME
jgi:hypothetical protein